MESSQRLSVVCQRAYTSVNTFLHLNDENDDVLDRTQKRVRHSLSVLQTMLDQFNLDQIAISYNGGKDCLVMLILYLSVLHTRFNNQTLDEHHQLNAVMINYERQFPELVTFINDTTRQYSLHLDQYNTTLKEGFEEYLDKHTQIKTIIVGTRRTDPYARGLKDIQRTDSGWPDFVRVHPVVDWRYDEVWCFLLRANISYCSLYDQGFTSLGGVDTTIRNPYLLDKETGQYNPAYMLEKGDERERGGRQKRLT
ncbi:putative FAD synthase [Cyberlindnera fabianii]|uniref:FAD synthase n=1 Tax=Cyberlindnera fabianii TaxID=36022 RepID=A0A1V2KYE7_CYBFA|nr:putative FAD synthase [Cyberlindnera fabianii]